MTYFFFLLGLLTYRLCGIIFRSSRPDREGCLISVSRRGAGSGGRGGGVGDAAPNFPSRRSKPRRPGVPNCTPPGPHRRWPPGMVGNAGRHLGPIAVERRPDNPEGEKGGLKRVSPPGAARSKPINTARGTPWVGRTCGLPAVARRAKAGRTSACLDAARHRGPWVRAPCLRRLA